MAAQGRSLAHCGARRVLVPSPEVSPESPGHGPVRPRSLCDAARRTRRLDREPRREARPARRDDAERRLRDPILREPPLAPEASPLREGREGAPRRGGAAGSPRARPRRRERAARGRGVPPSEPSSASSPHCARPRRRSATSSAPTAGKRSRWRDASRASGRPHRTASTSGSSRWGRTSVRCSVTAGPRSTRRRPRTGTSSSRDATGARGRASPGVDATTRFVRKVRDPASGPGSHE